MPTFQEIADRREELDQQAIEISREVRKKIEARIGAERRNLQETCGGLGHVRQTKRDCFGHLLPPVCVVCGWTFDDEKTADDLSVHLTVTEMLAAS